MTESVGFTTVWDPDVCQNCWDNNRDDLEPTRFHDQVCGPCREAMRPYLRDPVR